MIAFIFSFRESCDARRHSSLVISCLVSGALVGTCQCLWVVPKIAFIGLWQLVRRWMDRLIGSVFDRMVERCWVCVGNSGKVKSVCIAARCADAGFLTLNTDVRDYYRIVHLLLNVYMCRLSFRIGMH